MIPVFQVYILTTFQTILAIFGKYFLNNLWSDVTRNISSLNISSLHLKQLDLQFNLTQTLTECTPWKPRPNPLPDILGKQKVPYSVPLETVDSNKDNLDICPKIVKEKLNLKPPPSNTVSRKPLKKQKVKRTRGQGLLLVSHF